MRRRTAALPLVLLLAACGSRPLPGEEGAPKAVVLCPPERRETGETIAKSLNAGYGYDVLLKVTSIVRKRSTFAVYGVHDEPGRLDDMRRFADDLGLDLASEVDLLPFQQHATGGNAVVIWLAPDAHAK